MQAKKTGVEFLEHIKQMLFALNAEELQLTQRLLLQNSKAKTSRQCKASSLMNYILKNRQAQIEDIENYYFRYIQNGQRSFYRALQKIKEQVSATLLNEKTTVPPLYSPWYHNQVKVRKLLTIAEMLYGRSCVEIANSYYREVIYLGKKYELYDELLSALYSQQFIFGLRQGKGSFEKYRKEIEHYEACRKALQNAKTFYHRYFMEEIDFKGVNKENVGLLTEAISQLQDDFRKTNSANLNFYLHLLMMAYHQSLRNYEQVYSTGEQFIKIIMDNPALYMKRKIGIIYSDLADNFLFMYQFDKAGEFAQRACAYYEPWSYNYQIASEIHFNALFYSGKTDEAKEVIDQLLVHTMEKEAAFQYFKRKYLKACIEFSQGNFSSAMRTLKTVKEIDKDKEGWNIGIKVLEILCRLELNKTELPINNLSKYLNRTNEKYDVRQREIVIFKLLVHINKCGRNYLRVWNEKQNLIRLLSSNKQEYRWEVKTPEMIVFHKWLETKAHNKEFKIEIPNLKSQISKLNLHAWS